MTEDGNHGGATPEETGAALLVWSRSAERLLGPPSNRNEGGESGGGVGEDNGAGREKEFESHPRHVQGDRGGGFAQSEGGDRAGEGEGAAAEGALRRSHPFAGRKVAQIDLVPTVSLLLGTPIPFGSLGGVIPEVFGGSYMNVSGVGGGEGGRDMGGAGAETDPRYYERLCDALLVNSIQVWGGEGGEGGAVLICCLYFSFDC